MEWEAILIEWIQGNMGGIGAVLGKIFSTPRIPCDSRLS